MSELTRRTFAEALASGLGGSIFAAPAEGKRPNILFVCSDQHSGRVLGCGGHPVVRTPNLDRIASMGVLFRNAYSCNPVCVPARAAMMTGRFASDVNSFGNSTPLGREPSWGNRLRDAGYYCWATGKLDLTKGVDYGFQEVHTSHGHSQHPDITSLFRAPVCFRQNEREIVNGRFVERGEDNDGKLATAAIHCVHEEAGKSGKPWAVYVGMHLPHPKWVAQKNYEEIYPPHKMPLPEIPPGYLERRHTSYQVLSNFKNISVPIPEDRVRRARSAYFGMVTELDGYVGRILDDLAKTGELENTLLIYTSDHGEMLGEHGLWLKNNLLENAARVPLIMAGAGLPRGKVIEAPVSHVDAVATILDVAGAPRPSELRGHSLVPLIQGRQGDHPGFTYSESHSEGNMTGSFMIRKGDWKYIYFTGDVPLLFNVKDDPGEFRNLAGKAETAAIQRELYAHLASLVEPDSVTERAFVEQERRLNGMIRSLKPKEFHDMLVGRMGTAQARILTNKYYRRRWFVPDPNRHV